MLVLIAGVSFVAGLIHIAASIDHYQEFPLYTPVFALMATCQIAWALAIARWCSRRVLIVGVALNVAIIGLWVVSRTVGVPIASRPWAPEEIGAADLMATIAESAIVVGATCVLMSLRSALAQRLLARLAPVLLVVIFLSVTFGVGGRHAGGGVSTPPLRSFSRTALSRGADQLVLCRLTTDPSRR
ncbi:MAG: hypothetical protein M3065_13985 [Actinomycetota bacterium]|nr:hypothetical protein [Actinomycetota bacterium]